MWIFSEAVLACTHDLCFEQNKKKITFFHTKIMIFTAVKNSSILHRRGCVMFLHFKKVYRNQKSDQIDFFWHQALSEPEKYSNLKELWVGRIFSDQLRNVKIRYISIGYNLNLR